MFGDFDGCHESGIGGIDPEGFGAQAERDGAADIGEMREGTCDRLRAGEGRRGDADFRIASRLDPAGQKGHARRADEAGDEQIGGPVVEFCGRTDLFHQAAAVLQLDELLARKPRELSGGQRQRVAIGRAIVRQPDVFLFDEPLSNLDAGLRAQMRVEIARLHAQLQTTMIYVTHDQVEAMTLADRIVVLDRGVIAQIGAPLELYARPDN